MADQLVETVSKICVNVHIEHLCEAPRGINHVYVWCKQFAETVFVPRQQSRRVKADEETAEWIAATHCTYSACESQQSGTAGTAAPCSLEHFAYTDYESLHD